MRQRARRFLFCAIVLLLPLRLVSAQEYYGVPIEDGGVAFLLDVSGSMEDRSEQVRAAVDAIARDVAGAIKGTPAEQWRLGQAIMNRANRAATTTRITKMVSARRELVHALDSLEDGTSFTIITFGEHAREWPGGVRNAGASARARAREYVSSVPAAGGTPMAEALQLGFASENVRTLFVVSDGRPTTGNVLAVVEHLQRLREGRRMIINTVGIGADQDSGLLCQLARDNEGVYVRDGAIGCTFSPCAADDGIVTFYPPSAMQKRSHVTPICSSADHPDCTPQLVYETMLSEARLQTPGRERAKVRNCLDLERPDPVTIVIDADGREAVNYTRPGHPSHPAKITRIVKEDDDRVVVETSGAGKLPVSAFDSVDRELIEAVLARLQPLPLQAQDTPAQPPVEEIPVEEEVLEIEQKPPPV